MEKNAGLRNSKCFVFFIFFFFLFSRHFFGIDSNRNTSNSCARQLQISFATSQQPHFVHTSHQVILFVSLNKLKTFTRASWQSIVINSSISSIDSGDSNGDGGGGSGDDKVKTKMHFCADFSIVRHINFGILLKPDITSLTPMKEIARE